jgi:hypothetical protein
MNRKSFDRLVALAFIALFGCVPTEDASQVAPEPLIFGSPDAGDPAVMFLLGVRPDTSEFYCTASMITQSMALTSADCVDPIGPPGLGGAPGFGARYFVYPGALGASATPFNSVPVVQVIEHPAYNPANIAAGHDVAVLKLAWPLAVTPLPVSSAPTNYLHTLVELVGYGSPSFGGVVDDEIKRQGFAFATSADAASFLVEGPALPCFGDGGGPMLANGQIVGVSSYGFGLSCGPNTRFYTRIDANDDFVAQFLPPTGSPDRFFAADFTGDQSSDLLLMNPRGRLAVFRAAGVHEQ